MPYTAGQVISDALGICKVVGESRPITPYDNDRGIRILNNMMETLTNVYDIDVGYEAVTSIVTPVEVDDGAIDSIINMLAVELWPYYYDTEPSQMMVVKAVSAKRNLLSIGTTIPTMSYGQTLPTGSGNYNNTSYIFYPEEEES